MIKQEEVVRQERVTKTLNDIMNCRETSQSLTNIFETATKLKKYFICIDTVEVKETVMITKMVFTIPFRSVYMIFTVSFLSRVRVHEKQKRQVSDRKRRSGELHVSLSCHKADHRSHKRLIQSKKDRKMGEHRFTVTVQPFHHSFQMEWWNDFGTFFDFYCIIVRALQMFEKVLTHSDTKMRNAHTNKTRLP